MWELLPTYSFSRPPADRYGGDGGGHFRSFSERGALLYNIRAKEEHDPLSHFFSGMHIRCNSKLNCNDRITFS